MTAHPRSPTRRQRRDRALRRYAVLFAATALVLTVVWLTRLTANEAHARGVAAADRLDAAFDAVTDGTVTVTGQPATIRPGIEGAVVTVFGKDVVVLVSPVPGACYGLWWGSDLVRHGRIVDDQIPCQAAPIVTSNRPIHFERAGPAVADPDAGYRWDQVLPPERRLRYLVLPIMVVGLGVALSLVVRTTIVLITGEPLAPRDRR